MRNSLVSRGAKESSVPGKNRNPPCHLLSVAPSDLVPLVLRIHRIVHLTKRVELPILKDLHPLEVFHDSGRVVTGCLAHPKNRYSWVFQGVSTRQVGRGGLRTHRLESLCPCQAWGVCFFFVSRRFCGGWCQYD